MPGDRVILALCPNGCAVRGLGGVSVMTPKGAVWLPGHNSSCPALVLRAAGAGVSKALYFREVPA